MRVSPGGGMNPARLEPPPHWPIARSFDGGQLFAMTRLTSPRLCRMTG
jgi:hypothetical protein